MQITRGSSCRTSPANTAFRGLVPLQYTIAACPRGCLAPFLTSTSLPKPGVSYKQICAEEHRGAGETGTGARLKPEPPSSHNRSVQLLLSLWGRDGHHMVVIHALPSLFFLTKWPCAHFGLFVSPLGKRQCLKTSLGLEHNIVEGTGLKAITKGKFTLCWCSYLTLEFWDGSKQWTLHCNGASARMVEPMVFNTLQSQKVSVERIYFYHHLRRKSYLYWH